MMLKRKLFKLGLGLIVLYLALVGGAFMTNGYSESQLHDYKGNVNDICYMPTAGTMTELCSLMDE
jgi:hypothetical protein